MAGIGFMPLKNMGLGPWVSIEKPQGVGGHYYK
jgi:hypothetical protein